MSGLFQVAVTALDFILSEVFQTRCLGCDQLSTPALCHRCRCWPLAPLVPGARIQSALEYREPWRTVLHAVKFQRRKALLRWFRPLIENADFNWVPEDAWVVPVPLHWTSLHTRGFNPSEWLAEEVSQASGLALHSETLFKTRRTASQSSLERQEREGNLDGCMEWRSREVASSVLLVDDVFTSGHTLAECTRALNEAGIFEVYGWTLFRAKRLPS